MYRYNTENALLRIHSGAFSIYFIVDSVMRSATLNSQRLFCFFVAHIAGTISSNSFLHALTVY
jgi:hypothetical protein